MFPCTLFTNVECQGNLLQICINQQIESLCSHTNHIHVQTCFQRFSIISGIKVLYISFSIGVFMDFMELLCCAKTLKKKLQKQNSWLIDYTTSKHCCLAFYFFIFSVNLTLFTSLPDEQLTNLSQKLLNLDRHGLKHSVLGGVVKEWCCVRTANNKRQGRSLYRLE